MPRKTAALPVSAMAFDAASMRPRPDAAENVRLLLDLEDRMSRLQ